MDNRNQMNFKAVLAISNDSDELHVGIVPEAWHALRKCGWDAEDTLECTVSKEQISVTNLSKQFRDQNVDEDWPLSTEEKQSLSLRLEDLNDPTRYFVYSRMFDEHYHGPMALMYWCAEDDTLSSSVESATLFKRCKHAESLISSMDRDGYFVGKLHIDDKDMKMTLFD